MEAGLEAFLESLPELDLDGWGQSLGDELQDGQGRQATAQLDGQLQQSSCQPRLQAEKPGDQRQPLLGKGGTGYHPCVSHHSSATYQHGSLRSSASLPSQEQTQGSTLPALHPSDQTGGRVSTVCQRQERRNSSAFIQSQTMPAWLQDKLDNLENFHALEPRLPSAASTPVPSSRLTPSGLYVGSLPQRQPRYIANGMTDIGSSPIVPYCPPLPSAQSTQADRSWTSQQGRTGRKGPERLQYSSEGGPTLSQEGQPPFQRRNSFAAETGHQQLPPNWERHSCQADHYGQEQTVDGRGSWPAEQKDGADTRGQGEKTHSPQCLTFGKEYTRSAQSLGSAEGAVTSQLELGQTVFCSQAVSHAPGGTEGPQLEINWTFTNACAQLSEADLKGLPFLRLREEAATWGLTPLPFGPEMASQFSLASYQGHQGHQAVNSITTGGELLGLLADDDCESEDQSCPASPSRQESVSGRNSAQCKAPAVEDSGRNKENRSEAAQESMVGNPSSKRKNHSLDKPKKLILRLMPKEETLKASMIKQGLNPSMELSCKAKKELVQVLCQLQRKWESSCPGTAWPEGGFALRLYPTSAMPVLAGASWGPPSLPATLTLHDLHVAMGSPDTMPLLYAWHCIDGDGSQGLHQTPVHEPWRVKPTARVDTDGRTPMSRPTDDILSPDAAEQQVSTEEFREATTRAAKAEQAHRGRSAMRKLAIRNETDMPRTPFAMLSNTELGEPCQAGMHTVDPHMQSDGQMEEAVDAFYNDITASPGLLPHLSQSRLAEVPPVRVPPLTSGCEQHRLHQPRGAACRVQNPTRGTPAPTVGRPQQGKAAVQAYTPAMAPTHPQQHCSYTNLPSAQRESDDRGHLGYPFKSTFGPQGGSGLPVVTPAGRPSRVPVPGSAKESTQRLAPTPSDAAGSMLRPALKPHRSWDSRVAANLATPYDQGFNINPETKSTMGASKSGGSGRQQSLDVTPVHFDPSHQVVNQSQEAATPAKSLHPPPASRSHAGVDEGCSRGSLATGTSKPSSKAWSKNAAKSVSMQLSLEDSIQLRAQSKPAAKAKGAKKGQSCAEKEEAVSKPKRKYIRKKPLKGAGMRASGQGSEGPAKNVAVSGHKTSGGQQMQQKRTPAECKPDGGNHRQERVQIGAQGQTVAMESSESAGSLADELAAALAVDTAVSTITRGVPVRGRGRPKKSERRSEKGAEPELHREVLASANGRPLNSSAAAGEAGPKRRTRKRHGENADPQEQIHAVPMKGSKGSVVDSRSKRVNTMPSPAKADPPPNKSPRSVSLKTRCRILEDKTCDGFGAWAALSKQRLEAAHSTGAGSGQERISEASAAPEKTLPGLRADASLEPWFQNPHDSADPKHPAQNEGPEQGTHEPCPLDDCLLPEDLTLDFETFLNDTQELKQGSDVSCAIASGSLFPELFA